MPDKNNANLAKTPQFLRFFANSRGDVHTVLPSSPLQQIIKNIGVFVDTERLQIYPKRQKSSLFY